MAMISSTPLPILICGANRHKIEVGKLHGWSTPQDAFVKGLVAPWHLKGVVGTDPHQRLPMTHNVDVTTHIGRSIPV